LRDGDRSPRVAPLALLGIPSAAPPRPGGASWDLLHRPTSPRQGFAGFPSLRSGRVPVTLRSQRGSCLGALFKLAAVAVFLFVLVTCVAVFLLRWIHPLTSAYMIEARWHAITTGEHGYKTDFEWVDLEHISPHAAIAVVASEDQQFPFHDGFDFKSIRQSVRASEHGKRLRGASTISQQVAKNLFLWNGGFVRKGLEAYFTILIEAMWPKERILEVYLNIAQFGNGVYGVEAAAHHFFRKPAARPTSNEAALLAAVLPNPIRFRVDRPSTYVQTRRDWILGQMRDLGGAGYLKAIENENPASPVTSRNPGSAQATSRPRRH
jgi:monofunctional glycosyltransferase